MFEPREPIERWPRRYGSLRIDEAKMPPSAAFVIFLVLVLDLLWILSPPVWVWVVVLCLYGFLIVRYVAQRRRKEPRWITEGAMVWLGVGAVGAAYLVWREWPGQGTLGYGAAFRLGVGVGATAALVRVAIFYTPFRPPSGWMSSTIRLVLIFVPGAVFGALAGDAVSGLILWIGSLVGGLLSLFFSVYIPEEDRPRHDAIAAVYEAKRKDDRGALAGLLDSPYASARSFAVGTIARKGWRELTPALLRRLDVEREPEVRGSLALALSAWAGPATEPALVELLDDGDKDVRRFAVRGLSRMGDARAVPAAKGMYETGEYYQRLEGVWALLCVGTPEAEAALDGLLAREQNRRHRRQARVAIRRFRKKRARGKGSAEL